MNKKLIEERAHELEDVLHRLKRTAFASEDESGLKKSEIFMLWQIAKQSKDQPITPSEIAKESGVTMAAITHHINSLESQGCIERTGSKEDRRVVFISLSTKGREIVEKFRNKHWERLCGTIEYLGEEDSGKLLSIFAKMTEYAARENDKK